MIHIWPRFPPQFLLRDTPCVLTDMWPFLLTFPILSPYWWLKTKSRLVSAPVSRGSQSPELLPRALEVSSELSVFSLQGQAGTAKGPRTDRGSLRIPLVHSYLPSQNSGYIYKKTCFYENKYLFCTTLPIRHASCSFLFPAVLGILVTPTGSGVWNLVPWCFWRWALKVGLQSSRPPLFLEPLPTSCSDKMWRSHVASSCQSGMPHTHRSFPTITL